MPPDTTTGRTAARRWWCGLVAALVVLLPAPVTAVEAQGLVLVLVLAALAGTVRARRALLDAAPLELGRVPDRDAAEVSPQDPARPLDSGDEMGNGY